MTETVFLDESGYTGPDLNNPDQPFFAVGSLNISERKAETLKQSYFDEVEADELKYKRLSRQARFKKI